MTGAELISKFLISKGIKTVFCITGAGNLSLVDAIKRTTSIEIIYSHHEQAAVMEAQGYSRVTGEPGIVLVTTGGGTSNAMTGVLSAYLDSIPIILLSGNESSFHFEKNINIRGFGVQGFDSSKCTKNITKFSHRVSSQAELIITLEKAYSIANQDRKGPVHVDIPMDIQRMEVFEFPLFEEEEKEAKSDLSILKFTQLFIHNLNNSKKPLVYIGNGLRNSKYLERFKLICEKHSIPYVLSWSAVDLSSFNDVCNLGRVGIYGDRASNFTLQKSETLLCLGTRLAIPQVGYDISDFARKAKKWVVEIDPEECNKYQDLDWEILNADVNLFLEKFFELENLIEFNNISWMRECIELKESFPLLQQTKGDQKDLRGIHSADVIEFISDKLDANSTIVTDVGAPLLNGHFLFQIKDGQRFFTSQGLGEMGFGLPAAIGAFFADKSRNIVCLNTDGAMMFNLQEMQLVSHHKIPLKLFVFNNNGYSMIRISQKNLFNERYNGSGPSSGVSFPNYENIASTFGLQYIKLENRIDLNQELIPLLNDNHAYLFDVIMDENQKYLPRLATFRQPNGELVSPPLEDLDPLMDFQSLKKYLGYNPTEKSRVVRGMTSE